MELQKRSFRRPSSLRTSWMSVWMAFTGGGGVQHPLPRRSGNVVGVCLGGIRCSGSPRTSWVSVWVACNGAAEEELPKQSERSLSGLHPSPGGPRTSWVSVWVAFVAQAVRERRGCLSGWPAMELQKRSFRRPSSLRTSWKSGLHSPEVEECSIRRPSRSGRENVVDVCLGCIFTGGGGVQHPSPRRSGNVVGVCLGGIRCSGSPRTSWVSVWVACNGAAEEELPSTKQSENVVEVCLGGIHQRWRSAPSPENVVDVIFRRWRSAASVAQAVRKRRGCLSGWHSLLRQSENVVGVCLGGMQWSCRRGASVDQAV